MTMLDIQELIDNKLIRNRHNAVFDYKFQTTMRDAPWYEWLDKPGFFEIKDEYLEGITNWITSSENNTVTGLDRFKHKDLIHGTTQAFDEAYYRYHNRRLRFYRGEYAYHRRVFKNWEFLDHPDGLSGPRLERNDWIIISNPFCGTGNDVPDNYEFILNNAYAMDIPVLIDCAWYGTCYDINIDLTHPAITEVCFSLSKGLGVGNIRSGIRYSNYENDYMPIRQQNDYNHLPLGPAQIGMHMFSNFTPDTIPNKYKQWQHDFCKAINVQPSKCIHVALAPFEDPWQEHFSIDERYCKLGIREALKQVRLGTLKV